MGRRANWNELSQPLDDAQDDSLEESHWFSFWGWSLVFGLRSSVFDLCLSIDSSEVLLKDQSPKAKDRSYSRNEFLTAIQSYIKFGMIIPRRTILASCQGKA